MYETTNSKQSKMTAKASKYPQGYFKRKPCRKCGTEFQPEAPSHLYCSQLCVDYAYMKRYLWKNYKMMPEDYMRMLVEQDHRCFLCGGEGFLMGKHHTIKLVVDHCHETGKVRGLLCHNCNRALGLFQDSPEVLAAAAEYVRRCNDHPERE